MKKLLLSSAIAATMGMTGYAQAAVDLDDGTANPLTFAEEISLPQDLNVTAAGANGGGSSASVVAVETAFGFTIGEGTSKYVRLTFDEALGADLDIADFASDTSAADSYSISQGGLDGDTYVIVEVAAGTGGGDVLATDHFQFQPQTGDEITATAMNDRDIAYDLYETAVDAVNETNVLAQKSGTWISWGPGYEVSCTSASPSRIDVVNSTQFLNGTSSTDVTTIDINHLTVFTEAGVNVDIETDYFDAGSTITIAGSTTAFTNANGFTIPGEDGADAIQATNPDAAPADGDATWTTVADSATATGVVLPLTTTTEYFTVNGDTTTEMVPSTYSLTIDDEGTGSYDIDPVTVDCGTLIYSGSTDRLDFALTPDGVFTQMARITNPSNIAGDVTVTVYNDMGDEVTFDLGAIDGADTELEAKGSTKLININDIYAAAQAADSSFELAGTDRNKLRVEVRGEFGDDAFEDAQSTGAERLNGRLANGIYIQGLTVSRDNNAFFQTK